MISLDKIQDLKEKMAIAIASGDRNNVREVSEKINDYLSDNQLQVLDILDDALSGGK